MVLLHSSSDPNIAATWKTPGHSKEGEPATPTRPKEYLNPPPVLEDTRRISEAVHLGHVFLTSTDYLHWHCSWWNNFRTVDVSLYCEHTLSLSAFSRAIGQRPTIMLKSVKSRTADSLISSIASTACVVLPAMAFRSVLALTPELTVPSNMARRVVPSAS